MALETKSEKSSDRLNKAKDPKKIRRTAVTSPLAAGAGALDAVEALPSPKIASATLDGARCATEKTWRCCANPPFAGQALTDLEIPKWNLKSFGWAG